MYAHAYTRILRMRKCRQTDDQLKRSWRMILSYICSPAANIILQSTSAMLQYQFSGERFGVMHSIEVSGGRNLYKLCSKSWARARSTLLFGPQCCFLRGEHVLDHISVSHLNCFEFTCLSGWDVRFALPWFVYCDFKLSHAAELPQLVEHHAYIE